MTFELKKTYNFNFNNKLTHILGDKLKTVKVKAILSSDQAIKLSDIATLHAQVRPLDTTNIPEDLADMTFVLFETLDKDNVVYALEYIDMSSLEEVSAINIRVNVRNVSTSDVSLIKTTLAELGYENFDVVAN